MRDKQRKRNQLRQVRFRRNYLKHAEGSCLIQQGDTMIICSASVEESVPVFLRKSGRGWITAEYGMIPRSCTSRALREVTRGRPSGRTQEIQRLIGRALRAVVNLSLLGERTIWIDCDVVQADGGTRCASITGSFVALMDALRHLQKQGAIEKIPVNDFVAATSVGIIKGTAFLDLDYDEDSRAEVDMNVVMTGKGKFIEIQGTAEKEPFSRQQMKELLTLAKRGITHLIQMQKKTLAEK